MWNLEEAVSYYKKQGAPSDQSALVSLLQIRNEIVSAPYHLIF